MLLIIGDGAQEGARALAEHLQLPAGAHAGMALVNLSIWSDPAGGLLVVPRAPMRTVLIERGIVTFNPGVGIQVEAPATAISTATASRPRAVTASEPEFYEQLEQRRPGLSARLRGFVDSVADLGVTPDFPASLPPAGRCRPRSRVAPALRRRPARPSSSGAATANGAGLRLTTNPPT